MTKKISNSVFVVHGRNMKIRNAMFSFLRSLDLKPLQWEKIVKETGKTSPYIGDVLDKGFEIAQAIVVIMTPDDESRLKKEFHGKDEKPHEVELTGQPRPNVLIEAGMALGRNQNKTIIVEIGKMRDVSDLLGRNVIRMDNSPEKRNKLKNRLETAECIVDGSNEDWLHEGDFTMDETKTIPLVKKEQKNKTKSNKSEQEKVSEYNGLYGGIRLLVDEGYFDTVKLMSEIIEELENRGYVYSRPSTRQSVMQFAKKKKILNAVKRGKDTVYVIRR